MIDIIHDNFDNSFILAYNILDQCVFESFSYAMQDEREYSAVFAPYRVRVNQTLKSKVKQFQKKYVVD